MDPRPLTVFLLFSLPAVVFAARALPRATVEEDPTAEIRLGRVLPPAPPEVIIDDPSLAPRGDAPWAEERWYKRRYDYYFYPGSNVYFRPADRVWFYRDNGAWRIGDALPSRVNVDFERSVPLTIEDDRPYTYHQEIVARFPPDYFSRVQIQRVPENRSTFDVPLEPTDRIDRKARDKVEK